MPRLIVVFALTLLIAACAEPPAKEMHQAQGAIDAARAAGAEEYAADELKLAVDGLAKYQEAVAARDYRLALAHALDSRERAQNAAKTAVDGRAKARGDAERELAEAVAAGPARARHGSATPRWPSCPAARSRRLKRPSPRRRRHCKKRARR